MIRGQPSATGETRRVVSAETLLETVQVTCPWGHACTIEVPVQLAVFDDPDPRELVLGDRFNRHICPTCSREFELDQAITYVDYVRAHAIRMQRASDAAAWSRWESVAPSLFEELREKARAARVRPPSLFRLVFGRWQLREKLILWEAGLDDRLVEVLKIEHLKGVDPSLEQRGLNHLVLLDLDLDAWVLRFWADTLPPRGPGEIVTIGLDEYEALVPVTQSYARDYPELFRGPYVSALRYADS